MTCDVDSAGQGRGTHPAIGEYGSRVPKVTYRRFMPDDRMPAYRLFRASLWGYLAAIGIIDSADPPDVEDAWKRQAKLMMHTEQTAAEDWIAENGDEPVGWARTVERDDHIQLTHFFVHPSAQGSGIGRGLLDRTIPPGRGRGRSIMATMNPSALSLYLRYGVRFQGTGITFTGTPLVRQAKHDLEVRRVVTDKADIEAIVQLDAEILGYRRPVDIEFLVSDRPAFLFSRDGKDVGYAFGSDGVVSGPGGTLDPADFPAILAQVETTAAQTGQENI